MSGKEAKEKDTKESKTALVPTGKVKTPLLYEPGKEIYDAITGEELHTDALLALASDPTAVRAVTLLGWLPPLENNAVIGRLVDVVEMPSTFGSGQPRKVFMIDGIIHYYTGDSSAFTRSKTDPPFDPSHWEWARGAVYVGLVQGLSLMASKEHVGAHFSVRFGRYMQQGSRTKKLVTAGLISPERVKSLAIPV